MVKKRQYFIVVLLIALLMTACTNRQSLKTNMTLEAITNKIIDSQSTLPSLEKVTSEDQMFVTYLENDYHCSKGQVKEGVICYADGVEASEIAILLVSDEKNIETIQTHLEEYIQSRASLFEGYAPKQAAMIKNALVVVNGQYIALLICQDPSKAKIAFLDCFQDNEFDQNEKMEQDIYDSVAILKAWKTGDESSLSDMNLSILNKVKDIFREEIHEGMSDYEKELAIHDWITNWSDFDYSVFNRSSENELKNESETPYGVLIEKSGMCHGYSSTFQLLMDMLDIECITVYGIPNSHGVKHSWNMVKLDGDWYCVDVAWDDPIGGTPGHTYFNVTSQNLRESGIHHWDEKSIPEATATTYGYHDF